MRNIILFGLAAALSAAPALAQEQVRQPFTGLDVTGILGWDRTGRNDHDRDGLLYGGGLGYNVALGSRLIAGVEGEATDSTGSRCAGGYTAANPRRCSEAGRDLYVGGRLGTTIGDGRTLLYAKAGYTNARYDLTSDSGTGSGTSDIGHRDLDGYRVGAGIEHALSARTFVKAEYRYSNYQDGYSRQQVVGGVGIRF